MSDGIRIALVLTLWLIVGILLTPWALVGTAMYYSWVINLFQ